MCEFFFFSLFFLSPLFFFSLSLISLTAIETDSIRSIAHTRAATPNFSLKCDIGTHHETVSLGRPFGIGPTMRTQSGLGFLLAGSQPRRAPTTREVEKTRTVRGPRAFTHTNFLLRLPISFMTMRIRSQERYLFL